MSEYVNFHYMPLEGKITGEQVLKQTEDAINDLGNKVYNLDIDQSEIDEAIEKSNEAINTANSALSAVTTGRSVWFNNVAEMVATDIEAGVTAETKGYYVANDGGNALYLIRQEKSGDVVDGGSLIALDNGNMAELVTDGTVNVKQFGAIGNGTDDDTTVFQNTSSYAQANGFVPFVGVATYKITNSVTGTFNSFGEVTITGGGTVDIINLQEVVSDVSDIRDEVVDETASAKAYSESAATSATNASNSASSASTTATQLMAYLANKETLTAPAIDPTLTISGAAADAKVTGKASYYRVPILRNGSVGNIWNSNAICTEYVIPIDFSCSTFVVEFTDSVAANQFAFGLNVWGGAVTDGMTTSAAQADSSVTRKTINISPPVYITDKKAFYKTSDFVGYTHLSIMLSAKLNDTDAPLRIANNQYSIRYIYGSTDILFSESGTPADAKATGDRLDVLDNIVAYAETSFAYTGSAHSSTADKVNIDVKTGEKISIYVYGTVEPFYYYIFGFKSDGTNVQIGNSHLVNNGLSIDITADQDYVAFGLYLDASQPAQTINFVVAKLVSTYNDRKNISLLQKENDNIIIPILRNGSFGNESNANAVCSNYVIPILHDYSYIVLEFVGDTSNADEFAFSYCLMKGTTDGITSSAANADSNITKVNINADADVRTKKPRILIPVSQFNGYDHIVVYVWRFKNNAAVPIRVVNEQYCIKLSYENIYPSGLFAEPNLHYLDNARHQPGGTPLTILHFSDLHADKLSLGRIMNAASSCENGVDDIICTGDIVADTAAPISSWWDENVLTCIGNHDSASYNSGTGYDWTALSMADRDAYYIAPFESNWGITHTAGTSYYYKDYSTQKVRLIVMDAMLYTNAGAEATAQTAWLENLLADAITNNLHVIIAIHAPHGGATAVDCSFSRYNQATMPTYSDCNTPQAVIDTVETKITAGLKFIGYLVGHTHQDNIWNADGDGKQLMYCITCAAVAQTAQWINSDQNRSITEDAYNLVTIDTANTLVKIIRGGGADIDDHMRTRKAICFNYSTGEKVGEVL